MKLVDLPEAEDVGRQRDRNNTRFTRCSVSGIIDSRTTYSTSHGKASEANRNITEAKEGRRDRRRTTSSDDSNIIAVDEKGRQSSEDDTGTSTEDALKGYNQLQTDYRDLPSPDLFEQMFDFDQKDTETRLRYGPLAQSPVRLRLHG